MPPPVNFDRPTLQKYYNSPTLSDVTICFSDRRVHAHKMLLAMAMPYFEHAFTSGFAETESQEMWLHEDDPDAVEAMLRHAYGLDAQGTVNKPGIYFQLRLFTVASKYGVQSLVDEAVGEVHRNLAKSNVLGARWFPDVVYKIYEELPIHKRELRVVARDFCHKNYKKLVAQKDFKELLLDCPTLGLDMMEKMAECSPD